MEDREPPESGQHVQQAVHIRRGVVEVEGGTKVSGAGRDVHSGLREAREGGQARSRRRATYNREMRYIALAALLALVPAAPASAQIDARMFRYPAISADKIAFVYAGDIWLVPKAGGTASRLSSPAGSSSPTRSP